MNYQTISVVPVTPAIGGMVAGVDISDDLPDTVIREIRSALLDRLVIFFRGQSLDPDHLVAFAKRFGEIGYYPFVEGVIADV